MMWQIIKTKQKQKSKKAKFKSNYHMTQIKNQIII
jgi:hypothetical protein